MLPRLIPQRVFHGLSTNVLNETGEQHFLVDQRDCMENLIRNVLNLSFLFPNGELRPGVLEKLGECPLLQEFFGSHTPSELVDQANEQLGRQWLELTTGFEIFGTTYAQYNRELLTGLDNILSTFAGLIPPLRTDYRFSEDPNKERSFRLKCVCEYLSTETIEVRCNTLIDSNYQKVILTYLVKEPGKKKVKEKVTLFITTEHVSISHQMDHAC